MYLGLSNFALLDLRLLPFAIPFIEKLQYYLMLVFSIIRTANPRHGKKLLLIVAPYDAQSHIGVHREVVLVSVVPVSNHAYLFHY